MRLLLAIVICLTAGLPAASAQSGRVKPSESPAPTPSPQGRAPVRGDYVLTQDTQPKTDGVRPKVAGDADGLDDVIKVSTALVPIPVAITETAANRTTPYSAEDFELLVDGRREAVGEAFRATTPIRLAMLFDNSSSVMIARDFERQAAIRFFESVLRPDRDLAALFSVADYTRLEQSFTNDVGRLRVAINSFGQPSGATALLDGIVKATEYLSVASGRRVIVIVSDGEDTYSDPKNSLEEVIRILHRANVQVYVVKTKEFENFKRTGQRGGNANIHALTAERRMAEIAAQTGGTVYSPIDEIEVNQVFRLISAELAEQYVLAYYPEDDAETMAGRYRAIAVGLKGRPNTQVRYRKGYYVVRDRPAATK